MTTGEGWIDEASVMVRSVYGTGACLHLQQAADGTWVAGTNADASDGCTGAEASSACEALCELLDAKKGEAHAAN